MKLDVGNRIRLVGMLRDYKGSITDLRIVSDLLNTVGLAEDDFDKFKIKVTPTSITWDDKVESAEIEIGKRGIEIISDILRKQEENKSLVIQDIPLWDLFIGDEDVS